MYSRKLYPSNAHITRVSHYCFLCWRCLAASICAPWTLTTTTNRALVGSKCHSTAKVPGHRHFHVGSGYVVQPKQSTIVFSF
ncbi:unnamed protein product [Cuscuta campestris]|uniref:Uncharacterized protein n=1 Tax=Cuscuta campestris TaxID=132261 RepID=A0A484NTI4_9ASTE|nr:unnamed protein product [Cuscuta campestris]